MAKLLEMPKLSPTMEEGQLAIWHKKEGDTVLVDDLLAEVETDKATMEFRSFDKGTLLKILVPAGSLVKLGQPVAVFGNPGEDFSALLGGSPVSVSTATTTVDTIQSTATVAVVATTPTPDGRLKASPYVRKLAREHDLNLHTIQGSGPGGRIIARDLDLTALATAPVTSIMPAIVPPISLTLPAPSPTTVPSGYAAPEVRPLSMMRKTIARRLTEAKQTVPHFYLNIDVDAGALITFREQLNQELAASAKKGEEAEKISVNDLLIKACATALRRVPECNAQFSTDAILLHQRVDISVAVAVPDGLVTPVLRDADRKGVLEIGRSVRDLATRARAKKLSPEEMSNGTFSISNLGMFGIDEFAAVINPPEGAILAVGRVREEPVIQNGAVVPGKRLALTLSCDHRVIDGAVGARFLAELRSLLERPVQILLGP